MRNLRNVSSFLLLLVSSFVWGDSQTPRAGLTITDIGSLGWGSKVNNNYSIIDASMCVQGVANTFTAQNQFNNFPLILGSTEAIQFNDASTHYLQFRASDTVTTTSWVLPPADGSNGQVWGTDGHGNLSFINGLGNSILNQNVLQSGSTFYVSSGTVQGNLTAGNVFLSGISNGNCLQTGPQGQIFGAGFACGSGAGSGIANQNTLQSGATFYVSSGTVLTQFNLGATGSGYTDSTQELTINNTQSIGLFPDPASINLIRTLNRNNCITWSDSNGFGGNSGPYAACRNGNNFYIGNQDVIGGINSGYLELSATGSGSSTMTYTGSAVILSPVANGGTQCLHANNSGVISGTGSDCGIGSGGYAVQPATVTFNLAQGVLGSTFSFTGPAPSTVTYGLAVGSLTVSGVADQAGSWSAIEGTTPPGIAGYITLTADTTGPALKEIVDAGATYYVDTSSVAATAGHVVGWGPGGLGQLVDIGPYPTGASGGPTGSLQLNAGGGLFTGSPAYVWSGSSLTIISSVSVTNAGGRTNGAQAGYFDVFHSTAFAGQYLFSVGSENQSHQFYVPDQQAVNMNAYGTIAGALNVGNISVSKVIISNSLISSTAQKIDMGSAAGVMQLETASIGSGGGDIVLIPETSTAARFNSSGATISSSMTIAGGGGLGVTYNVNAGSYSVLGNQSYQILYSSSNCVTASSATTSATFVPTNLATTLTPHQSTSRIEITVTGLGSTSAGSTDGLSASIFRGSTNLAASASGSPIMASIDPDVAGTSIGQIAIDYIDLPNTTSPVTYTLEMHTDGGGGTITFNRGPSFACMTVKEWSY